MVAVIIILVIVVLLIAWIAGTYNKLVAQKQRVGNAWSQIDVQLQRRFDLIPNLVEIVKGYMAHEAGTLEKVTELRTAWTKASSVEEKAKLDNELSNAMKTIMAVSESYPDLKANQNFLDLSGQLNETENKISFSRQFYNDTVTRYNTSIEMFPSNIIAGMFHFSQASLCEVQEDEARKNVKISFDNK